MLTMAAPSGSIHAQVSSCTHDNYGFLVQVTVDSPSGWFPKKYQPDHLLPKSRALVAQVSETLLASEHR
jgi:hypothetical protein